MQRGYTLHIMLPDHFHPKMLLVHPITLYMLLPKHQKWPQTVSDRHLEFEQVSEKCNRNMNIQLQKQFYKLCFKNLLTTTCKYSNMPTASKALTTLDLISSRVRSNLPRPNAMSASSVDVTPCNRE